MATSPPPAVRPLTRRQARFVSEYLKDLNGTQAVIRSGMPARIPRQQAWRLLRNPRIAAVIAAEQAHQLAAANLTAQHVLDELRRIGLLDAREFWGENGQLKPIHTLTPAQGAALAGYEVFPKRRDDEADVVHKIRFWDKPRALELLAKHFGLLKEVQEHSGEVVVTVKVVHEHRQLAP